MSPALDEARDRLAAMLHQERAAIDEAVRDLARVDSGPGAVLGGPMAALGLALDIARRREQAALYSAAICEIDAVLG